MVWAAISYAGALLIVGIEGNMGSKYYCDVLEKVLISKASEIFVDVWTLVQEGTSVHSSVYTKAWLEAQNIQVLP